MRTLLTLSFLIFALTAFGQKTMKKGNEKSTLCFDPTYKGLLHFPFKLEGYFDYEEGLKCAKMTDKPVLLFFTGHGSIKSREMEWEVWQNPEVLKLLRDKFVITALYIDDKSLLAREKLNEAKVKGDSIDRIGKFNHRLQKLKFNENIMPAYYIIDKNEKLLAEPYYYDLSIEKFKAFLEKRIKQ